MLEETVISAWEAGWAIGILFIVLIGVGTGAGWFLKAYLKQQKEDFVERKAERERKDSLLMEQHEFIRDLAAASMKETAVAIAQISEIRSFMRESTRSLSLINEQLRDHASGCAIKLDGLKAQNEKTHERIEQLQHNARLYA